jgi:hypothetical protein
MSFLNLILNRDTWSSKGIIRADLGTLLATGTIYGATPCPPAGTLGKIDKDLVIVEQASDKTLVKKAMRSGLISLTHFGLW